MKKDVILALIFGLGLGAAIAVVTVKIPDFFAKNNTARTEGVAKEKTQVTLPPSEINLEIKSPPDQSIVGDSNIKITGVTRPASTVVVESNDTSLALLAGDDGTFSANLKLNEGGNPVYITSLDSVGNSETKSVNYFYTAEKL